MVDMNREVSKAKVGKLSMWDDYHDYPPDHGSFYSHPAPKQRDPHRESSKRRRGNRGGKNGRLKRDVVFERDGHACVACFWPIIAFPDGDSRFLTLDHRIPLSKGGGNTSSNLDTMCNVCNAAKDNMLPEEWYSSEYMRNLIQNPNN